VVAALVTRSVVNLRSIEPGFRSSGVLTGRVTLTIREGEGQAAFFDRLDEEIARLPHTTATSLSTGLPGTGWNGRRVAVAGRTYERANERPVVRHLAVTPGFFKTFDVAVLRGRPITAEDRAGALPVVVVNQRLVDENFRGADPIGQRINLTPGDTNPSWVTIVGVIPTLYSASLGDPWPPELLTAFRQESHGSANIAIRTTGDPTSIAQPLRTVVASLDRDLPVYSLAPMSDVLAQFTWPMRIFGGLFLVFGIVALALASIGLYAVLAFSVSRREREMGIRMALGAAAADVVRLVFRDAAVQLASGVSIGLMLGVGAARLARAALFGVEPTDPATIAVVLTTLAVTGFAACVVPALRATKSDPVRSLRAE
jgi:putative ABC transport system permease protein